MKCPDCGMITYWYSEKDWFECSIRFCRGRMNAFRDASSVEEYDRIWGTNLTELVRKG